MAGADFDEEVPTDQQDEIANGKVVPCHLKPVGQLDQLVREAGRQPPYLPRHALASLEQALRAHGIKLDPLPAEAPPAATNKAAISTDNPTPAAEGGAS